MGAPSRSCAHGIEADAASGYGAGMLAAPGGRGQAHDRCVLPAGPGAISEVSNGASRRAGCVWLLPLLVLHLLLKF